MRTFLFFILLLVWVQNGFSAPQHLRRQMYLSEQDQEFSQKLSRKQRKVFCGQFNQAQREKAIHYALQGLKTPDEAVIRVMEETGMPLSTKRRQGSSLGVNAP